MDGKDVWMNNFAFYTSICEEDKEWIPQYLQEMERLQTPFVIHFDRCSDDTKQQMVTHSMCIAHTISDVQKEYTELVKNIPLQKLLSYNFPWIANTDIDEIYEDDAVAKLEAITQLDADYVRINWRNCWGDLQHIRAGDFFEGGKRCRIYNTCQPTGYRWKHVAPTVNGCKLFNARNKLVNARMADSDLVCIHCGLMTHELRVLHKERWDRIYGKVLGKNPYGIWKVSLMYDEYPPVIVENPWLKRFA